MWAVRKGRGECFVRRWGVAEGGCAGKLLEPYHGRDQGSIARACSDGPDQGQPLNSNWRIRVAIGVLGLLGSLCLCTCETLACERSSGMSFICVGTGFGLG